jgi:hypothetical protein
MFAENAGSKSRRLEEETKLAERQQVRALDVAEVARRLAKEEAA